MSSLATIAMRTARPALRTSAQVQTVARRQLHHGPNWHFPFYFTAGNTTKRALAMKLGGVMTGAFLTPFVAIWWHWNRPGGLNNPSN